MPDLFNSGTKTNQGVNIENKENIDPSLVGHPPRNLSPEIPQSTSSALSAFCYYPNNVKFINEDPGEKIILLIRKHPITNLKWILAAFLLIVAPFFFPVFEIFELLPGGLKVIIILTWYLVTSAFIIEEFLSWFFHVNIVTDERLIEVDFAHLLYREITDANIDQIQDVTPKIGGGIRTLFNFGDIVIQTASAIPMIDFNDVPQPDRVARILRELRVQEETEKIEGRVR